MTAFPDRPLQDPLYSRPLNFPFPLLILLMALAVSGCGLTPESEAATSTAAVSPAPTVLSATAPPGHLKPPWPSSGPGVALATPEPTPPDSAPPEKTYPEPAHLSSLDGSRILALLGVPGLKRHDDPAEIWLYQTRACTLHIFLYQAAKGDAYRVRHFETRARGKDRISEKACFIGFIKAHEQR